MNWIKQNTFLAGLLALLVVGIIGLGYFFMTKRGEYAEAQERLETANKAKKDLQTREPFPSEENAEAVRGLVNDYRQKAEAVANKLYVGQAPMAANVRVAQFQEDLALKAEAVKEAASNAGVALAEGFYLGFEKYSAETPLEGAVGQLQYQLDATVWLTNLLFANDVKRFAIEREQLSFEKKRSAAEPERKPRGRNRGGDEKPKPKSKEVAPVAVTYPMEIAIELPERSFQNVLNALSNSSSALGEVSDNGDYYFVTRWMRVENEQNFGPERSDEPEQPDPDEEGNPVEAPPQEINMIFGRQSVRAYLALDLVRFLPKEQAVAE